VGGLPDVLVLCYHAVSPNWDASLSVTPDRFWRQLQYLVHRGYRGATFRDALTAPPAPRTLAITFDDSYRSVAKWAFPMLESLDLPATVFVPTCFIGRDEPMSWPGIDRWIGGAHEDELRPLSWQALRRLVDAGWEVGSHTVSHPRLTSLDYDSLRSELNESKLACERALDSPCTSISYPYGDVDARVVAAAAEAGYRFGATLPRRFNAPQPLQWPRVGVWYSDEFPRFRLKAAKRVRDVRTLAIGERLAGPLRRRESEGTGD